MVQRLQAWILTGAFVVCAVTLAPAMATGGLASLGLQQHTDAAADAAASGAADVAATAGSLGADAAGQVAAQARAAAHEALGLQIGSGSGLADVRGAANGMVRGGVDAGMAEARVADDLTGTVSGAGRFNVRNVANVTATASGALATAEQRTQLTSAQSHVNTHAVAQVPPQDLSGAARVGSYTGLDTYHSDLTNPGLQAHETDNVDTPVGSAHLDSHTFVNS